MSWLDKLKKGMQKTAGLLRLKSIDPKELDEIEELFIQADAGVRTACALRDKVAAAHPKDTEALKRILFDEIVERITPMARPLRITAQAHPFIILFVGVNGAGKTTTIGKLGALFQSEGHRVAYVAADTFRAGAVAQLQEWGRRTGCPVYAGQPGADAAAVVFEGVRLAQKNKEDVLLIDTAGRLHNRTDLMDELQKIKRVIQKLDPDAPQAVLLVLDATGGQNVLSQVRHFQETIGITGLIMTKLDGTAKGGILLALAEQFNLPVHALGVGEQSDDLRPFTAVDYAASLLGDSDESH